MTGLVRQAAQNNASLCGKVLAAHGIASTQTDACWHAEAAPIPFYPALVTLAPGAAIPAVMFGGIKDSFNDLAPNEFTVGIEGHWWQAPSSVDTPARPTTNLERWSQLWSGSDISATFPAILLDDPDMVFACTGDGGGLLNLGGGAVGISNTFGRNPLSALAALAQARWPGIPVVLWQDRLDTADLKAARFQCLAPMRVWFPLTPG